MECQRKQRKYRKLYCPHCDKSVSKSTWYAHYNEFFDQVENNWKTVIKKHNDSDFNFGSDSNEDPWLDTDGVDWWTDSDQEPHHEQDNEVVYCNVLAIMSQTSYIGKSITGIYS